MIRDIAVLTGATVITDELGYKLENATMDHLGRAKSVVAKKDNTTIIGGEGDKELIDRRVAEIRVQIENTKSDYDKEKLAERLAKLSGGIAVIKVGAASEVEMKEKKLRIEDALNATKAAVEEGVVAGGGIALLKAGKALEKAEFENKDQEIGAQIVIRALAYPTRKIAENAGKEGAVIVDEILRNKDANFGYDAATDTFVDLVKAGIIDPKKVARSALENAISVAGMFLTTEAIVVEAPKKESCCSAPHAGGAGAGMGGMGDMY
jgi:chaperonin GroEL